MNTHRGHRHTRSMLATLLLTMLTAAAVGQDTDGDTLSDLDEVNVHLTDPLNPDTDGDGLRDDWEILGVPYTSFSGAAKRYPLPVSPSNPFGSARRRTIHVETDSMAFGLLLNQSFLLPSWWRNVPVSNPDGSTGIDLVITTSDLSIPRAGWTYDPGSGINWPPEFAQFKLDYFGTATERNDPDWYGPGQTSGPMREAKLKAFHYAAFADTLGNTTVSGLAEFPGNDMIITLGGWYFGALPLTPTQLNWMKQVSLGVFAHELGHNLGLDHGGGDAVNFKPNYHSVMNYSWTVPRYVGGVTAGLLYAPLPPTSAQAAYGAGWSPLFSDTVLPSLNEGALSETATSLCGGRVGGHAGHVVPVGPPGPWGYGYLEFASGTGIDWDRDGVPGEPFVQAALNNPIPSCGPTLCDSPCTLIDSCGHSGYDDWSNLQFLSTGGNYASGVSGATLPAGEDLTFQDARMLSFVGGCSFADPFDFYEAPVDELHGRGGWKGWDNDPAFSGPIVQAQSFSLDSSLRIAQAADLVHEFCAGGAGAWSLSAWQYIPSDFASGSAGNLAGSYFVLMNTYADGEAHASQDWSVQVQFDSNDQNLKVFHGDGLNTVPVPYETDRWVKLQVLVDLDNDWTQIYYDDDLVTEYPWTGGVLGEGGGALDIAAVDLFANGSSPLYYDDLRLESGCGAALTDDDDLDGLDLRTEFLLGTNACAADSDEDGLDDGIEITLGTEPLAPDTDGDGLRDGDEVHLLGTDPLLPDTDGNGTPDGEEDFDFDELGNAEEIEVYETDPLNPDTDSDNLPDGEEVNIVGTDPLNPDTDADGHLDGLDNCPTAENPSQSDLDGDGVGDACDCPGDADGSGTVDLSDLSIVLSQFGQTGPGLAGDLNGDGTVNLSDLGQVLALFGSTCL